MRKIQYILFINVIICFFSCKKETSCEGCKENNKPPIAIAGPDQVITLPTDSVLLDGRGSSDPDGTISEWLWKKVSGPASFPINNPSVSKTIATNLAKGIYEFELKVTDNGGLSSQDTMKVIVNDPTQPNRPPEANAGLDQTITLPTNSVNLNGSGSTDPDNNIVSYLWIKISGPSSFSINNANAIQAQVSNLIEGAYQFELRVTDAGGLFSKDTISIGVNPQQPIVPCSDAWSQLQPLPADEFFFAPDDWFGGDNFLFGAGNKVYAVSKKGRVWIYDGSIDTWSMIGNFPENMNAAPLVFNANGNAYFLGNGHCWQFSAASNQWGLLNGPPEGVSAPLTLNNRVYMRDTLNRLIEYDPISDSYLIEGNCPTTLALIGWFVVEGFGYYVDVLGRCWRYDPINNSWQQKSCLCTYGSIDHRSSFGLNSFGYILGDYSADDYIPMMLLRYDSIHDVWKRCVGNEYPGQGAYQLSNVSFTGIVYVGLGYNNGNFSAIDFWKFQ